MPKCPECGSEKIEKAEIDQTEDGAEVFKFKCLKCGHTWEDEE
jgi:DNA-directed RNA polymerase subunit M/transcription elongation factor TFIIS